MKAGYLKDISFFTSRDDSFVAVIVPFLQPWNVHEKETVYKLRDHPNQSTFFIYKHSLYIIDFLI